VARQLTHDELEKAAHNLERIDGYLSPRSRWTVSPAHLDTLASMRRSVSRLMKLLHSTSSTGPPATASNVRAAVALDPAELDVDQLHGFASFLERLDRWLEASGAVPPATGATELMTRILASLQATNRALEELGGGPAPEAGWHAPAAAPPIRSAPAAPAATPPTRPASVPPPAAAPPTRPASTAPTAAAAPSRTAAGRSAGPAAIVDDVFAGAPRPAGPAPVEQIALTASEADPMFRWIGPEDVELTPRARERIEQLFAAQGITFFRYQLENFASEVRRRIKTAPEGHVLVIKVRDIGGERKPFLSYVPAKMFKSD